MLLQFLYFIRCNHLCQYLYGMVVAIIGIEAIIIFTPVSKLDIHRQQACFDKFQIENEPSSSSVSVNKRVNPLKTQMKFCNGFYDMPAPLYFLIVRKKLFHLHWYQIRLWRRVLCSQNLNWYTAINSPI